VVRQAIAIGASSAFVLTLLSGIARAAPIACPEHAHLEGSFPPNGNEAWCEMEDASGRSVKSGPWMAWYENGQVRAEGEYLEGRKEGRWTIWSPDGEVIAELLFEHGIRKDPAAARPSRTETTTIARLPPAEPEIETIEDVAAHPTEGGATMAEDEETDEASEVTDDEDLDDEASPELQKPPPEKHAPPVHTVLRAKPQSFVDQLWASVTMDSDLCEYELGVPFELFAPLPYFGKRIAPHWWVGGSTELVLGQVLGASSAPLVTDRPGADIPSAASGYTFLGLAAFVRGVFTIPSGLLGIMVWAKGVGGAASVSGATGGHPAALVMLEADLLLFNEHIILAGGSLGVGYDMQLGDPLLAYAFRTLGIRFTF
jgi:hypothetical protein